VTSANSIFKEAVDMTEKATDRPYRPLVYVASAYSGDVTTNTEKAKQYCRFALEQGQIPLAPHLMFPLFMNDDVPKERELAIFMDVILLGKCDELWVFGDCITEGMRVEIEVAKKRRQKIRYFSSKMQEVKIYE
jgi:hypothetical protein